MIRAVEELLTSFDNLPEQFQQQALVEILQRVTAREYGPLSDEALCDIADQTFQRIDEEERLGQTETG
ncbi:MAG: hypothetical protein WD030_08485 [Pirellulales bacterium]